MPAHRELKPRDLDGKIDHVDERGVALQQATGQRGDAVCLREDQRGHVAKQGAGYSFVPEVYRNRD
ncbi:hypothetical protein SAMN05660880_02618 [Luteibacter sp. 22Crub2.1]|nr:hypothetical protein SAMN05660880_02618 [Luteibacter sp. 22Crub2.1]